MPNSALSFLWPAAFLPEVSIACRAPLAARGFSHRYLSPTHALHLHGYHGRVNIDGILYDLAPGDITFSPARRSSCYDLPRPGWHWCVHFQPAPGRRGDRLRFPRHFSLGAYRWHGQQRMQRLADLWTQINGRPPRSRLYEAILAVEFQHFLLWLAEILLPSPVRADAGRRGQRAVQQAAAWIAGHFNEPLLIPTLAERLQVSQNYLARRFREHFGMTMSHYLLTQRLQYAHHLLTNTDMPVGHIARQVGLPDPRHFNKQFRRFYGQAPSLARVQRKSTTPA